MEAVLAAITEKKQAFARQPFFAFLRDESLEPEQRLAFYPCMAHWIMSFADLNKYFLRAEADGDPCQQRVNLYSHEDDDHWRLYLEDFQKLGFDSLHNGSGWLRFLWGDETRANRMLSYRIANLITGASSAERLAIIEAMEEAANVFFPLTVQLAEQIQERTGVELRYLGHFHSNLEAEHTGAGDHESLAQIELDDESRRRALEMVSEVFRLFEDWAEEVLRFAVARLSERATAVVMALPPQNNGALAEHSASLAQVM
ncbi:MAG TPA: hypothetical protein VER76_07275 [Pyrinomonadaceae bacterium]|nr:hypothetical protein [Pyrinomonadaceae bacterium]